MIMTDIIRRRITWILVILAAAILYLFANDTVTLALLLACIAAPLLSLVIALISGRHITISLEKTGSTDKEHTVRLQMHNHDIMPVGDIEIEAICLNMRTGESETAVISRSLRSKGKTEDMLTIVPDHAGKYEVGVGSAIVADPLRLWHRKITAGDKVYITVLPETFDMGLELTGSSWSMPESDRYVDGKSGNDPGEVRGIREYVAGDSIKNIHWKLSEKVDKLLVRELGLPITDQFLVILDNAADVGLNPDALDAIASVYASVLRNLLDDGMSFTTGWTNPETGEPVFRNIRTEEDLLNASEEYLAVPATTRSAFERIERGIIDSRFAHLIIAGSQIPSGIDSISNGCQVTLLMFGAPGGGRSESGASIVGFDEKNYREEVTQIEV